LLWFPWCWRPRLVSPQRAAAVVEGFVEAEYRARSGAAVLPVEGIAVDSPAAASVVDMATVAASALDLE
jgi:hypothetical protein